MKEDMPCGLPGPAAGHVFFAFSVGLSSELPGAYTASRFDLQAAT
jgi:hypothetical protein